MEVWKDIQGYEGLYQVSNMGRVRSLERKVKRWDGYRTVPAGMPKIQKSNSGYFRVELWKDWKGKKYLIHRLVAQAFIPNPENLPQVNHLNEDKTDNRVENLEWCTAKYNSNYGTHNEKLSKAASKAILQYTQDNIFVAEYASLQDAERVTGVLKSNICQYLRRDENCRYGNRQSAGGYIWKYKEAV